jgi:catechol 2,3-dioxygenase-like lactoylglutathione lyase family enzyme
VRTTSSSLAKHTDAGFWDKDAPISRSVHRIGVINSRAILGGLHHHYARVLGFRYTQGTSYLNLIAQPAGRRWSWWGRVIFYVADVDALYDRALAAGYQPATAPRDAEWGERFFHLTDPDGHELSFARPLLPVSVQ